MINHSDTDPSYVLDNSPADKAQGNRVFHDYLYSTRNRCTTSHVVDRHAYLAEREGHFTHA